MTPLCAVCGNHAADPVICGACRLMTAADLAAIRRNAETLADHLEPTSGAAAIRGVPGSRPPLRVDTLSLAARGGIGGLLGSWVQLLLEEDRVGRLPDHRLAPGAYAAICGRLLATHLDWMLDQPFADELAGELRQLRHDIDACLGQTERTWHPLPGQWGCPDDHCHARLLQKVGDWVVRCPGCGRRWEGEAEIERLGLILGCEIEVTIHQAAALAKVSKATIYRWIDAGELPSVRTGDRTLIDKRDLALVVYRRVGA